MTPKISIIIPVYNGEKYLIQCVNSLLSQTYKNLEIILINDGSTDGSKNIISDYANKDSRIYCIDKDNTGVSDCRNLGISKATGDYLMFLDSDDWMEKETCATAVNTILSHNADVVFWNYTREFNNVSKDRILYDDEKIVFSGKSLDDLHRRFVGLYGKELAKPEAADSLAPVWGKLYKAKLIKESEVKFIETSLIGTSEDTLFNLQVFGYVKVAVYLRECFYHYRKQNESFTKGYKTNLTEQWKNLFKYIEKYIVQNDKKIDFEIALRNRISLSIIGLGMNILRGKRQYQEVKSVICSEWYSSAVRTLDSQYFPIHWKIFFWCVKLKWSLGVLIMLKCIKILKGDRT